MKVLFTIIFASFLSFSVFAQGVTSGNQFKNGNNIEIKEIEGNLTVHCNSLYGNISKYYRCQAALISPGSHDYFVTKTPYDADKLSLTATRKDGSKKTKNVGFDAEKSISKSRINLVMKTLTQSPLLKLGENQVEYTLTKGKEWVAGGSFQSQVTMAGYSKCKPHTIFESTDMKCQNQTSACDHYFWLENNCQY